MSVDEFSATPYIGSYLVQLLIPKNKKVARQLKYKYFIIEQF